jgi:hypothetical protein
MGHVLISPLNWGLGHASRDIPVIKELLSRHHDVTIAACGNALTLLKREFPGCTFIEFQDYPPPNNNGRLFFPTFTAHIPALIRGLSDERRNLKSILANDHYDLIISDSRPGVYSETIPSIHITHQVHQAFPLIVWPIELVALYVNARAFRKYTHLVIADNKPKETALAGKLSRTFFPGTKKQSWYSGILASVQYTPAQKTIDFLIIVSGMEPQRTALEKIILPQVQDLPGKKVVLLGKPSADKVSRPDEDTEICSYVSNAEKINLMCGARFIICRSGYTSMMDLAELEVKNGLFIPTPGQWEQEYLSAYYQRRGWFMSRSQFRLKLRRDVERAQGFSGFPQMPKTQENVRRLYDELLAQYLER